MSLATLGRVEPDKRCRPDSLDGPAGASILVACPRQPNVPPTGFENEFSPPFEFKAAAGIEHTVIES
ncbi:MAG: hypothetical protein GY696_13115 [Gammaproteobacteria bacterium]|nr:hypothetical protein [Gammaproteobacteria bacterium]